MRETVSEVRATPFVKWAGGKRQLLDPLLSHVAKPSGGSRYIEPFVGGGALFFALRPDSALLNDANAELINAYSAVRDDVDGVIAALKRLRWTEDDYYRIRASRPRNPRTQAARFIYLNKTCFNGLYRVNLRGEFNVPYGKHPANHLVCDEQQLRAASSALRGVYLSHGDFETVMRAAQPGDVVYCDPPYTTSHSNNGFIEYNARVFSWPDQHRLASTAAELASSGVQVVISNGDHPSITSLYDKSRLFEAHRIQRWSTMAGASSRRRVTTELILVSRNSTHE